MSIKLFHLSDVHFGIRDEKGEQDRILEGIEKYIAKHNIKTDYLVFTGDLTQKAEKKEFEIGAKWLEKIANLLDSRILIVPGNHDVNRPDDDDDIDTLRTAYPIEDSYNRQIKNIYKKHDHLKPFLEWATTKHSNALYLNKWHSNPLVDVVKDKVGNVEVTFICSNTATLSCDDSDEGKLCIDVKSLNQGLGKINTDNELVIVLGHHPINWLANWNKKIVNEIFNQETGPHIYLHGHLHDAQGKANYNNTGCGVVTLGAGAAYQGSKWSQAFAIVEIDLSQKIYPDVIEYSNDSGSWDKNNKLSKNFPARLPCIANTKRIIEEINVQHNIIKNVSNNPFDNVAANDIDSHIIPDLFVDENNFLNRITNKFDAIVEGQRGTGKTMLLRYLSIDVQRQMMKYKKYDDDLSNINYVGIYCRISTKGFSRTDLQSVEDEIRREALFSERATLFFISCLIDDISALIKKKEPIKAGLSRIRNKLFQILKDEEIKKSECWSELKYSVIDACDNKIQELDEHVASLLPSGHPTTYNTRLAISTTFNSLLRFFKRELDLSAPFYLLVDDFDALSSEQQQIIFKSASERNHSLICYKFVVMTFGRKTNLAGKARTYREGDDYDLIELIWLDKGLEGTRGEGNYKKTVINIANKRIASSGWPKEVSFSKLFQDWKKGSEIRNIVRKRMKEKYDGLGDSDKPNTFQNYFDKQAVAEYFKYCRSKKIEHRYAGQNTIIEISSGVFRQFLEICSHIVTKALDAGWKPGDKKIGIEIQSDAIKTYSNSMIKSIGESAGDTSSLSINTCDVTGENIVNLAESLSTLFYERLHSDIADGEVIAISIRGVIEKDSFGKALLDVAVRESILHRRKDDYPAKTNKEGKLPTYVLNRRLVPRKNIGVKLQGRLELTISDIELAAKDRKKFERDVVQPMIGKKTKKSSMEDKQGGFSFDA
jgi:calcineurin-like phosphoesterase family protein/Cdc6-like AAA superfamily ATPase